MVKSFFLFVATLLLSLLLASSLFAQGQTRINGYNTARDRYFWTQLYVNGGRDLYCGVRFQSDQRLSIEHIYAADWIADRFGCDNRNCGHPMYRFAEADLHNLWPAIGAINSSRGKLLFGVIRGNKPTLPASVSDLRCDYERGGGVVEPRDSVKGDIARSIFYMHVEYSVPLNGMLPVLKAWHRRDLPNQHERWRNKRIFDLQGTRNRFIDQPILADVLE